MKIAICIAVHHKPYMIMSTIISLAVQTFTKYDLHFLFIKGDGNNIKRKEYREYNSIKKKNKKNRKLSAENNTILKIIKKIKKKTYLHSYINDQALDSGAWYRFINEQKFKEYDYCMFLMEGSLFKSEKSLEEIILFLKKDPDCIMLGAEKLLHPKNLVTNEIFNNNDPFDELHKKNTRKVYDQFSKNKNFRIIFRRWNYFTQFRNSPAYSLVTNYPHQDYFSTSVKIKLFIKYIFKEKKIFNPFKRKLFFNEFNYRYLIPSYYVDKNEFKSGNTVLNLEMSEHIYVNGCQHIYSNRYLKKFKEFINKYKIMKVINLPFSATPLEVIWGFMPKTLGYKKWFADCIHRPRKNFLTYAREDNIEGINKYLTIYSKNVLEPTIEKRLIKIKKIKNNLYNEKIHTMLGKFFFIKN